MKTSAMRAGWIFFGSLAIASFAAPTLAQTAAPGGADALLGNPLSGDNPTSSDPFSETGSGQMSSIMNIIQGAMSGGYIPPEEFSRQQRDSINTEASDFRARQLELLQQQSQPTVPTINTIP
jgi:hypothetical protein